MFFARNFFILMTYFFSNDETYLQVWTSNARRVFIPIEFIASLYHLGSILLINNLVRILDEFPWSRITIPQANFIVALHWLFVQLHFLAPIMILCIERRIRRSSFQCNHTRAGSCRARGTLSPAARFHSRLRTWAVSCLRLFCSQSFLQAFLAV